MGTTGACGVSKQTGLGSSMGFCWVFYAFPLSVNRQFRFCQNERGRSSGALRRSRFVSRSRSAEFAILIPFWIAALG